MHDVSKQEKVLARANPVWITHNLPPGRWGRSDLCRDDTSGAPRHGWPCLAVSCASGWAKNMQQKEGSQHSDVILSELAHASSKTRTARSMVRL